MGIYLDHAATTPLSEAAKTAMQEVSDRFNANPSSLHTPGREAKNRLEQAREVIAALLHAAPKEIYFTSGGTEADNWAVMSGASVRKTQSGVSLITSKIEHHAVLGSIKRMEGQGSSVIYVDVESDGIVSMDALAEIIGPGTAFVSVMHVNNEVGTIQPISEIAGLCRENGVLFHTDAVQSVGHLPVDVRQIDADYLSFSAHKFGGPRGIGVLYVRSGTPLQRLMEGGGQERDKRPGTENLAAIAGMQAALEDAVSNMEQRYSKIKMLRQRLCGVLCDMDDIQINGNPAYQYPGILSLSISGVRSESLLLRMDMRGVYASGGAACAAGAQEPSHVLTAMGLSEDMVLGSIRLSLGHENTMEEMEYAARVILEETDILRSII